MLPMSNMLKGLSAGAGGLLGIAGKALMTNRGRTIAGAALGGMYGAYRGDNYSASSILGGAMMGAGAGRYGGAFLRSGMMRGSGIGRAGRQAMNLAASDGRALIAKAGPAIRYARASRMGQASSRFIGRAGVATNNGLNKFRALGHEFARFTG